MTNLTELYNAAMKQQSELKKALLVAEAKLNKTYNFGKFEINIANRKLRFNKGRDLTTAIEQENWYCVVSEEEPLQMPTINKLQPRLACPCGVTAYGDDIATHAESCEAYKSTPPLLAIGDSIIHNDIGLRAFVEGMDERELIIGAFYWVLIALDPDGEDWENEKMPGRFIGFAENGDERFQTIGCEDTEWPVIWIGDEIVLTPKTATAKG